MLNADRLTVKAAEALNESIALARENGNPLVYDGHLLLALLGQTESIVVPLLNKVGVDAAQLRSRIEAETARYPRQSGAQPSVSRELNKVLDNADEEARTLKDAFVS